MRRIWVIAIFALSIAACSRQEAAWSSARSADTTDAYGNYLRDYPAGRHAGDARERLQELRERQEWEQAARLGTPEAYQRYLAGYPDGRFAAEARARLSDFLAAQAPAGAGAEGVVTPGTLLEQASVGHHRVQIGAFGGGEVAARSAWLDIAARHADLVSGLVPRVDAVERDGRTLWRLQAGPASEARAQEICAALNARGAGCVVVHD